MPLVGLLISTSTIAITDAQLDAGLDARLAFIERSLEGPQLHARLWWWGWLSVYSAAIVVQSTRLALVDPEDENRGAIRADSTISMVKAALAITALLVWPFDATRGARDMEEIAGDTREDELRRLAAGVAALERNAKQSELRGWWVRHAALLAINLVHGLIVWIGYDDPERGMISAGIGIVVGETIIFSQPWQPRESWQAYQALF